MVILFDAVIFPALAPESFEFTYTFMQMQLTSIDPATAEAWLKKVPTGSRINRRAKRNYADLLVSKRWVPTHQGPVFDTSDRLISGAELLAAIFGPGRGFELVAEAGRQMRGSAANSARNSSSGAWKKHRTNPHLGR